MHISATSPCRKHMCQGPYKLSWEGNTLFCLSFLKSLYTSAMVLQLHELPMPPAIAIMLWLRDCRWGSSSSSSFPRVSTFAYIHFREAPFALVSCTNHPASPAFHPSYPLDCGQLFLGICSPHQTGQPAGRAAFLWGGSHLSTAVLDPKRRSHSCKRHILENTASYMRCWSWPQPLLPELCSHSWCSQALPLYLLIYAHADEQQVVAAQGPDKPQQPLCKVPDLSP